MSKLNAVFNPEQAKALEKEFAAVTKSVEAVMKALLDKLAAERKVPLLSEETSSSSKAPKPAPKKD